MRISAYSVQEKKEKLDGVHLVLPCAVDTGKEQLQTTALVDSGANGIAFMIRPLCATVDFHFFNFGSRVDWRWLTAANQ
jgi:hypothetical protein